MTLEIPAYIRVLIRHLEDVGVSGGLHHIQVFHDDDCAIFDGGVCACEPEVVSGASIDALYGVSEDSSDG